MLWELGKAENRCDHPVEAQIGRDIGKKGGVFRKEVEKNEKKSLALTDYTGFGRQYFGFWGHQITPL